MRSACGQPAPWPWPWCSPRAPCSVRRQRGQRAPSTPNPEIASAAPAELRSYYTQQVDWTACEADFECAKIKVPLDYSKPDGDSIEIAALKLSTKGSSKKGSLLVNPGGPGGSGYDFVRDAGTTHFSEKLRANYDIVGFDPRGVKRSAPVTCLTDQERDASRAKIYDLDTDAGLAETLADNKAIAAKCEEKTGPVLGHIDTVSAAKDLDILRAVLNDTKLNYLGFSYGTFLGSTYASLFPDNVGRMVLDGAMDPSLSYEELTSGQAKAFEKAIRAYVDKLPRSPTAARSAAASTTGSSRSGTSSPPWRRTRCAPRTAGWSSASTWSAASSSRSTTTTTGRC